MIQQPAEYNLRTIGRNMKKCAFFALIIIAAISCQPKPAQQRAQVAAVRDFYRTIMTFKDDGVPSNENIGRLSPYISRSFRDLLLAALAAEERDYQRTKGSEPPLVEGSLFYSLFEGADRVKAVTPDQKHGPDAYLVSLEYGDPKVKRQFTQWQDRADLVFEDGRWVVNDLELLGDWPFGSKGKLSVILHAVAAFDDSDKLPN
jgi:hypothetical protein